MAINSKSRKSQRTEKNKQARNWLSDIIAENLSSVTDLSDVDTLSNRLFLLYEQEALTDPLPYQDKERGINLRDRIAKAAADCRRDIHLDKTLESWISDRRNDRKAYLLHRADHRSVRDANSDQDRWNQRLTDSTSSFLRETLRHHGFHDAASLTAALRNLPGSGAASAFPAVTHRAEEIIKSLQSQLWLPDRRHARTTIMNLIEEAFGESDAPAEDKSPIIMKPRAIIRETSRHPQEKSRTSRDWEKGLISAKVLTERLGLKADEIQRWIADGRIPTAKRVPYRKSGKNLSTTLHDPGLLDHLPRLLARWRLDDASTRKPGGRIASGDQASPAIARTKRRLSGLVKAAFKAMPLREVSVEAIESPEPQFFVAFSSELNVCDVVPLLEQPSSRLILTLKCRMPLPASLLARLEKDLSSQENSEVIDELAKLAASRHEALLGVAHAGLALWAERIEALMQAYPGEEHEKLYGRIRALWLGDPPVFPDRIGECQPSEVANLLAPLLDTAASRFARDVAAEDIRRCGGIKDYPALFARARSMKRELKLFVGPTNSGKTHAAMNELAAAETGLYAAPLRLMALEAHERMGAERRVPCSMVTGEEMVIVEGARHIACTIEMSDLDQEVEVAVIDEIQMLGDQDRGWAWTQALIGIPARTIIMTGSPDAIPRVARIAALVGEELEIVTFQRKTPLKALKQPLRLHDIRAGDAVVAFSRTEVMKIRSELTKHGLSVATIYGALSPEVRRAEAKRFREGEAEVLVATDAIGMGLNLPIQRVVLSDTGKYDGRARRDLLDPEIRQICGRAGRYGFSSAGEAAVLAPHDPLLISEALHRPPEPPEDTRPLVMPPWPAVDHAARFLGTDELASALSYVADHVLQSDPNLIATDLCQVLPIAQAVDQSGLSLRVRYRYLGVPADTKNQAGMLDLRNWAHAHAEDEIVPAPEFHFRKAPDSDAGLAEIEEAVKIITMYLWLALRWPEIYVEAEEAATRRSSLNRLIEEGLRAKSLRRSCRNCRSKLSEHHPHPICDDCFQARRP